MRPVNFTDIPLASRPKPNVWQVLAEQTSAGQATLYQDGEVYLVHFVDEEEPIPFGELSYNTELGLYDKRKFPNV